MSRVDTDTVVRPDAEDRAEGDHPCVCCGKETKGDRFVHLAGYGGDLISIDEPILEPSEDLGWFPIGPECARKLPKNFVAPEPGA